MGAEDFAETKMEYILNFENLNKGSLPIVGGKNASLGEMIKAGIRVPPGFAVTTDSYLSFITQAGIKDTIQNILSHLRKDDVESLNRISEEIQGLIHSSAMPDAIQRAIADGYKRLCGVCGVPDVRVAVRSSATAEDLPTASFAGQQDTYLCQSGVESVISSVRRCWASLFTPRAIDYRNKNQFLHEKVFISVGVQKMVKSRAAGVMFTLNPTNGDPSKVVIEGSWGLGEAVVSGSVNPDKFVVDKVVLETSEKTISTKHIKCIYSPNGKGTVDVDVEADMQTRCCLEDREVKELVTIAKSIEAHYGRPMDIEWAVDEDFYFPENIFIVQARPETVWSQRQKAPLIGQKSGFQLLMDQAMKRIKLQ